MPCYLSCNLTSIYMLEHFHLFEQKKNCSRLWTLCQFPIHLVSVLTLNSVFPKCFHWIRWIHWQKNCHYIKRAWTCHPATSCVRGQDHTTVPARHMWETGSLNWAQFMLQWFIRFPEFSEFLFPFGENSNVSPTVRHLFSDFFQYQTFYACST